MSSNGNGHNETHCHRCIAGTLFREGPDIVCLNCGFRLSYILGRAVKVYLAEAICARLLLDDSNEIDDIMDRDFKLAGMAR